MKVLKKYKHLDKFYLKSIWKNLFDKKLILLDINKGWNLHSGIWSPIYIQLRKLISLPRLLNKIVHALSDLLEDIIEKENGSLNSYSFLGIAMSGIPISTALSLKTGRPSLMTRKIEGLSIHNFNELIQKYGSHSLIEGTFYKNQSIILIDDLITSFESKKIAIELLKMQLKRNNSSLKKFPVRHLITIIDREQTDLNLIYDTYNIKVHSLIKLRSQGLLWIKDKLDKKTILFLENYFENKKYQS